ncbi:MAG TPA: hypothetical protein VF412_07685 [Bdellovibrio sp.]|uniref:hypothetical protein n=1 Tax=Bdellovibrio sp. TaxID=28201 RepID=UPI002F1AF20C
MKCLLIFLSLFILAIASIGHTHPGGPVIPPWPVSISTQPLIIEDLPGEWIAYDHNTIWFIQIELDANGRGLASIHMQSNAIRTHKVDGWLAPQENSLSGELNFDGQHSVKVMIFRDYEGTKLRIAAAHDSYYDLKLYRREQNN